MGRSSLGLIMLHNLSNFAPSEIFDDMPNIFYFKIKILIFFINVPNPN